MEQQFNVVFTGELKAGTERETFIQAFCQRFQCDEAKAIQVADASKAITMKTAVSGQMAEEFKKVLEGLGMTIRLVPIATAKPATGAGRAAQTAPAKSAPPTANPYQAPTANLQQSGELGEMSGPVSVPFGNGWQWLSCAYSNHFKGSAGAWIGAVLVLTIMSLIPVINMLTQLLMPLFIGGLMLGAKAQDEGEPFQFNALFRGFKQNSGQLALLSVLFIAVAFVMFFLFSGVLLGSMAAMGGMGEPGAAAPDPLLAMLPVLAVLLVFFPIIMAYWFAPALIAINGLSAISAMKLSFMGCLKNMLPFTLYGIALLVLTLVAMLPLGLGLLVLLPVMYASMYTAYRDIYYGAA